MSLAVVRLVSDSIANKKIGFGKSIFKKCLSVNILEKIFVYLVHFSDEKITPQNVDKLNSINSIRDFNLEFVSLEKQYIKNIDLFGHETDVLIKLYAPELFPHLKKILWLGNDIIVNDEISELYERDLSNKYISGVDVSFYYNKYCFNNFDIKLWINSSVLLYNLEKMEVQI